MDSFMGGRGGVGVDSCPNYINYGNFRDGSSV